MGIKRHAFKIHTRIGVDRASGKIVAFAADHILDGGGLANFSGTVAKVGAQMAIGVYDIPRVDVPTVALHSRGVTAGSMRGYGVLETNTALEALVDEMCAALSLDPIDFRRRNALKTDGRTLSVNQYDVAIRMPEILDKLEKHPIWQQRADEKARAQAGTLVGTGVACTSKNYGSGGDASLSTVEIGPDGRIVIYCDGAEMGNGIGTAVANRVAAHLGGVADAMTHCFNRWAWAQATFAISGQTWTADIDALAVRRGGGKFARLDRSNVKYPPTDFNKSGPTHAATCGALVRVEIERATGALRIAKAYSVLECGQALVPEVVLGQAQGGFAMAVGFALLESLPPYEGGPGNGKWNLGQYVIARGSDLPLHDLEVEVLSPIDSDERPKGMAEVVMMPAAPALINAIYDATGHRFRSLPVTQAMIKGALK